ncbi:MAG: NERD domain-containing protein [Clostridia bacterium]|nr:NERD domain-containing protein [Clostridia bacterium]
MIAVIILFVILLSIFIKKRADYKKGTYYQSTGLSYFSCISDKGKYGEYNAYKHLKQFETVGSRFLFNLYIPKEKGGTTEIDLLMICPKGIFVFESKNYGGWIFGKESQRNWCQALPKEGGGSQKHTFYNPIMQNRTHIKYLKSILGNQVPLWSIIVFSDRCNLKSVEITSNDVRVINQHYVASVVSEIYNKLPTNLLSEVDVINIYNKLYPYTQIDVFAEIQHIMNIYDKQNLNSDAYAMRKKTAKPTETTRLPNENVTALKCPKCNGKLVLRTAKKGKNVGNQFYGCSNYPKCKFIQNLAPKN